VTSHQFAHRKKRRYLDETSSVTRAKRKQRYSAARDGPS
jgi:hypothetical protein